MDEKKTTQVLKEIFDLCGIEVLKDRKKFQSCLEDLLNSPDYNAERLVLGYALNSSALWPFTKTSALSPEQAGRAVEQLQTENRMTEEDAVFVVRCVAAARGGNPDMVSRREPEPKQKTKPTPKPTPTLAPTPESEPKEEDVAILCKFREAEEKSFHHGMVHLLSLKDPRNGNVCRTKDRLRFESHNGDSSAISLTEVKKVKTYIEFMYFGLIAVFGAVMWFFIYWFDINSFLHMTSLRYSAIRDITDYWYKIVRGGEIVNGIVVCIVGGGIVGGILYMCAYRCRLRIDTWGLGRYFIVCDSPAEKKYIVEFVRSNLSGRIYLLRK